MYPAEIKTDELSRVNTEIVNKNHTLSKNIGLDTLNKSIVKTINKKETIKTPHQKICYGDNKLYSVYIVNTM